jgi:hypothetical protein
VREIHCLGCIFHLRPHSFYFFQLYPESADLHLVVLPAGKHQLPGGIPVSPIASTIKPLTGLPEMGNKFSPDKGGIIQVPDSYSFSPNINFSFTALRCQLLAGVQ